jgi:hypothetical protein
MKKISTLFLKIVILFVGVIVLISMLYFPQTEGRAKDLDLISIYSDPFIIYIYFASLPFFIGLYQAFRLLGYVEKGKIFTQASIKAMKNIKYCALIIPVLIIIAEIFVLLNVNGDDPAGFIALGIIISFISIVTAVVANVSQKLIQNKI